MHALRLLHKMMAQACPQIHAIRLTALMASVEALLVGRQMSLAGLGRAMVSGARVKHNIKRVDRLIGNRHLWGERTELYGAIAGLVLGQGPRPVIILDWSDLREPWILVTSLGSRAAQQVMRCYQLRMQIEESFRDMKNARLGLHFRSARSNSAERLSILVLIGTLATLVAWLVGQAMQRFGLQRHYQANTTRHRPVLSTVFLGLQSFRRQPVKLMLADIKQSIIALHQITASPLSYA